MFTLGSLFSGFEDTLHEIVANEEVLSDGEIFSRPISGVSDDSRSIQDGEVYFAISGAEHDGLEYVAQAVERGASFLVVDASKSAPDLSIPVLQVNDVRRVLALACNSYFDKPSESLTSIAVTGTNGKTSVTWILARALNLLSGPCGLVGTLGLGITEGDDVTSKSTINTTPHPKLIQEHLATIRKKGAKSCVLEATSQGIAQRRCAGIQWDSAIFTNLSRDHLDLHGSMQEYALEKYALFFDELTSSNKTNRNAIINIDDEWGVALHKELLSKYPQLSTRSYSISERDADCCLLEESISSGSTSASFSILGEVCEIRSSLIGRYNLSNLLAAVACLHAQGFALKAIAAAIEKVPCVPGRLELVAENDVAVYVDYCHTPDALLSAQSSLMELNPRRLITVFGCGGDRDRGKRSLMGKAVAAIANHGVVTSDNPRTEDPDRIIDDVEPGLSVEDGSSFTWERIVDRAEAISHAINIAEPGDIVLVAGKGHEDYQEIGRERIPFLDKTVCLGAMRAKGIL
jgi:UDP-N-acetylmuramoyl-L-alanyl-D-glutamate--2,6-diaminopimelate ligase